MSLPCSQHKSGSDKSLESLNAYLKEKKFVARLVVPTGFVKSLYACVADQLYLHTIQWQTAQELEAKFATEQGQARETIFEKICSSFNIQIHLYEAYLKRDIYIGQKDRPCIELAYANNEFVSLQPVQKQEDISSLNPTMNMTLKQKITMMTTELENFASTNASFREALDSRFQNPLKQLLQSVEAAESKKLFIGFMGEIRSGKSTLINSTLGIPLLTGAYSADPTTSCITDIYRSGDDSKFTAKVHFVTKNVILKDLKLLKELSKKSKKRNGEEEEEEAEDIVNFEWSDDDVQEEGDEHPTTTLKHALKQRLNMIFTRCKNSQGKTQLKLKREIEDLLNKGFDTIECDSIDEFKEKISQYISSEHTYWTVCERLEITGPFKDIPYFVHLIDMPGLSDENAYREKRAQDYIQLCDHICLVITAEGGIQRKSIAKTFEKSLQNLLHKKQVKNLIVALTKMDTLDQNNTLDNAKYYSQQIKLVNNCKELIQKICLKWLNSKEKQDSNKTEAQELTDSIFIIPTAAQLYWKKEEFTSGIVSFRQILFEQVKLKNGLFGYNEMFTLLCNELHSFFEKHNEENLVKIQQENELFRQEVVEFCDDFIRKLQYKFQPLIQAIESINCQNAVAKIVSTNQWEEFPTRGYGRKPSTVLCVCRGKGEFYTQSKHIKNPFININQNVADDFMLRITNSLDCIYSSSWASDLNTIRNYFRNCLSKFTKDTRRIFNFVDQATNSCQESNDDFVDFLNDLQRSVRSWLSPAYATESMAQVKLHTERTVYPNIKSHSISNLKKIIASVETMVTNLKDVLFSYLKSPVIRQDNSPEQQFLKELKNKLDTVKSEVNQEEKKQKEMDFGEVDVCGIPYDFICPISLDIMIHPVIASDGHTYDLDTIMQVLLLSNHPVSPKTRESITFELKPNVELRETISLWRKEQQQSQEPQTIPEKK